MLDAAYSLLFADVAGKGLFEHVPNALQPACGGVRAIIYATYYHLVTKGADIEKQRG